MASDAALNVRLGAKTAGFDKAMKRASARVKRFGRSMKRVGSNMTRNFIMPIALIGIASVKMSLDFEKSMTKVNTLVGVSKGEVEKLKKSVLELSGKTATAPNELAEGLYFLTSAGLSGADAMEALEQVSKGVAAGLGESADLANVAAAAQNAYGKDTMSASNALDIFGGMVKTGMFNAADLSKVLGTQLGLAANLGISFEEVGALISTYTRTTGDAIAATTGISGVMMSFAKITPKQAKALADVGLTADGVVESIGKKGLQATLIDLQKRFEKNGVEMSEFFSKSQSLKAVLGVLGGQTENYKNILDELHKSQGFVNTAFEDTAQTSAFKMTKAINDLKVAGTQLGNTMFPIVDILAKKISALGTWFSKLSDEQKKNVVKWGLILAAVGPILSIFGSMTIQIGALIPVLVKVARGFKAVTLAMMSNPYLAVGALIAGFIIYMATLGRKTRELTKSQKEYNTKLREAKAIMTTVVGLQKEVSNLDLLSKEQKEQLLGKIKLQKADANNTLKNMKIFARENVMFKSLDQTILKLRKSLKGKGALEQAGIWKQINALTEEANQLVKTKFGETAQTIAKRANQLGRDIKKVAKSIGESTSDLSADAGTTEAPYDPLTDPAEVKRTQDAAAKVKADAIDASNNKILELKRQFAVDSVTNEQSRARLELDIEEQKETDRVRGMENGEELMLQVEKNYTQKRKKLLAQQSKDTRDAINDMPYAAQEAADKMLESWEKFAEKVGILMNGLSNLNSALSTKETEILKQQQEEQTAIFDSQMEADAERMTAEYDTWFEDNQKRIEQSLMSEESKSKALENLEKAASKRKSANDKTLADKQKAFDEKQEKDKRKLARKQAIRERVLSVANIIMSTASGIMKAVSSFWITGGMPWAGIIAAMGAAQIGTVLSTPLPSLASGGVAFGESVARVGDYSGASTNPEVIAPLDKLKGMIGGKMGNANIKLRGELLGNNIFLSNEKTTIDRLRFI